MSSASAGGTAGGPVIDVDDMTSGLDGDASAGLIADFDLGVCMELRMHCS